MNFSFFSLMQFFSAYSGCFWTSVSTNGASPIGSCDGCFSDPLKLENLFLSAKAHEGKKCDDAAHNQSSRIVSVTAASTGCSGGFAIFTQACGSTVNSASTFSVIAASLFSVVSIFVF